MERASNEREDVMERICVGCIKECGREDKLNDLEVIDG